MDILTNLTAVLNSTPLRWTHLVEHTPDDLLRLQPAPGQWSALGCLLHMVDMEDAIFASRVRAILAGENFPAFFPDETGSVLDDTMDAATLAQQFATKRADSLILVGTLTSDDLVKTAVHGELGEVSLSNLLHEWGGHDLMHLVQAEQAMMQPFIEGCGAWQSYFSDHVAKQGK
ncbi:MAG: DinB family protein [Aggregatilineales bacterium]